MNKKVIINNLDEFIKQIKSIPQEWLSKEKSKLREFCEYLTSYGLITLNDCKEMIKKKD